MGNTRVLTVKGRYEEISRIVRFVSRQAAEAGLDEDAVFHVELCCDEACTNIIEHAYAGENQGEIAVSTELKAGDFRITIRDHGQSFNPAAVPPPPIPPDVDPGELSVAEYIEDLKVGGLGIHFMRQLMDEVHFEFDPVDGNTLIMVKRVAQ